MNDQTHERARLRPEWTVVRVWDPLVRVFHWVVVTAFVVAYVTEDELMSLHVWAGYLIGVLIVLRIVWGFVGPKHARFSDFVYRPIMVRRYVIDLIRFRAKRYLGHSPAGGAMIVALLAGLLFTVWSGLEVYAVEDNAGPLAAASIRGPPGAERSEGRIVLIGDDGHEQGYGEHKGEDEHRQGKEQGIWKDVHEAVANFVVLLVVLHVGGVLLGSLAHRENLILSMVTGKKRAE